MTSLNKLLANKYFWSLVLAALLGYFLIMEYTKPDLHNLNKTVNYYNNSIPMSETVISEKLKDPNTLEQEMINNMVTTTKTNHPQLTPRYHPLLPNSAGSSLVE